MASTSSTTNSDGSSVDCIVTNTSEGEKELVETTTEDCMHDFTCEYVDTGWQTQVRCPGKMNVYHYKQVITYSWSCTMYSDGCSYTYTYDEPVTINWTENGYCIMENGRSCCPDYSLPVGGPPGWPPPGWSQPVIVGPDERNPFVPNN